eukprot:349835-Chlamydomonas_euryale.AAC.1
MHVCASAYTHGGALHILKPYTLHPKPEHTFTVRTTTLGAHVRCARPRAAAQTGSGLLAKSSIQPGAWPAWGPTLLTYVWPGELGYPPFCESVGWQAQRWRNKRECELAEQHPTPTCEHPRSHTASTLQSHTSTPLQASDANL